MAKPATTASKTRSPGGLTHSVRLVRILLRLQGRHTGLSMHELGAELGVSRSQLRRDLLALEEAGIRLSFDREPGRYGRAVVRILDADATRIPITRRERYTLLAVRRMFDVFRGTPLYEDVASVYEKLLETLPGRERRDLRQLDEQIVYLPSGGTKHYSDKEDVLDALQTGVMMGRRVNTFYRPRRGAASEGVLEPYALIIYRNGLYVVASRYRDGERGAPRVFAVERFEWAQPVRRSRFAPPEDLDIDALFDGAFGLITGRRRHRVVLEFAAGVRTEVLARRFHRTQVATEIAGGRVRLELEVTSLRELTSWVLGWGPAVKVVEPEELRGRVTDELERAAAQYRD